MSTVLRAAFSADVPNAAKLPKYVHDHSRWLIEIPIRIAVIIVVSLVIRAVLHRLINRLIRPVGEGSVPRILRPFKERAEATGLLNGTGLLSERRRQRAETVGSVLKSGVSFTILVIASLTILSELNVDLAPFIAGTSIVGVALGFGAQNIVKDFLSGMFMMLEDQYGVGDVIDFEKATGTVEGVGLRTTRLRDVNGTVWYVRNGEVVRVGNKSQGFARVVLDVPVAAAADIDVAGTAMLAVAREMHADDAWHDAFLDEPELQGVERLSLDETVLRLVARVRAGQQWRVARELRRRIRERLDRLAVATTDEPAASTTDDPPR